MAKPLPLMVTGMAMSLGAEEGSMAVTVGLLTSPWLAQTGLRVLGFVLVTAVATLRERRGLGAGHTAQGKHQQADEYEAEKKLLHDTIPPVLGLAVRRRRGETRPRGSQAQYTRCS